MKSENAIEALLALGQETRLAAYRLLVEHEPHGLPSGEIAAQLGANASTVSRHLAQLERANLLRSWREQRQIMYAINHDGTEQLLRFLTEDCCRVHHGPHRSASRTAPRRKSTRRREPARVR